MYNRIVLNIGPRPDLDAVRVPCNCVANILIKKVH
jgi:hypothetical protein